MSDVLVKNMKMPNACACCDMCILSSDKQNFFCKRQIGKRFHWSLAVIRQEGCPLVELPENHGRIVDLDKVLDWLINEDGRFSMAMNAKIDNALKNAPILLEASHETGCPHYLGVCGLDEDAICYCSSSYEMCDKYREAGDGKDSQD